MTPEQLRGTQVGVYRLYWYSGGYSLASVGRNRNGDYWHASANWTGDGEQWLPSTDWTGVKRIEVIEIRGKFSHRPSNLNRSARETVNACREHLQRDGTYYRDSFLSESILLSLTRGGWLSPDGGNIEVQAQIVFAALLRTAQTFCERLSGGWLREAERMCTAAGTIADLVDLPGGREWAAGCLCAVEAVRGQSFTDDNCPQCARPGELRDRPPDSWIWHCVHCNFTWHGELRPVFTAQQTVVGPVVRGPESQAVRVESLEDMAERFARIQEGVPHQVPGCVGCGSTFLEPETGEPLAFQEGQLAVCSQCNLMLILLQGDDGLRWRRVEDR